MSVGEVQADIFILKSSQVISICSQAWEPLRRRITVWPGGRAMSCEPPCCFSIVPPPQSRFMIVGPRASPFPQFSILKHDFYPFHLFYSVSLSWSFYNSLGVFPFILLFMYIFIQHQVYACYHRQCTSCWDIAKNKKARSHGVYVFLGFALLFFLFLLIRLGYLKMTFF